MICIYKISNNINNKVYIGSTKDFISRVRGHKSLLRRNKHHSKYLQNFYNKYGDVFTYEIIEDLDTMGDELIWDREEYWINYYKAYNPKFGFNEARFPRNSKKYKPVLQYSLEGEFIKEFDSKKEAILWLKNKNLSFSNSMCQINHSGGYQWKFKENENIIKNNLTYYSCYDKEGNLIKIFNSIENIKDYFNNKAFKSISSNINRSISNNTKTIGYYWRKFYNKQEIQDKINIENKRYVFKKVYQYDLNNNLIKIWDSVTELAETYNSNIGNVSRCINGRKVKTFKGTILKLGS